MDSAHTPPPLVTVVEILPHLVSAERLHYNCCRLIWTFLMHWLVYHMGIYVQPALNTIHTQSTCTQIGQQLNVWRKHTSTHHTGGKANIKVYYL